MEKNIKNIQNKLPDFIKKSGLYFYKAFNLKDMLESFDFSEYSRKRPESSISSFEINSFNKGAFLSGEDGRLTHGLSFAIPYFRNNRNSTVFSLYTRGEDYHKVVEKLLNPIRDYILDMGYSAKITVDSNSLPERFIALRSGLVKAGKNGLVYLKDYGSYVFLGEILTDFNLDFMMDYSPVSIEDAYLTECRDCYLCINACPGRVLNDKYLKVNQCLSYFTQDKTLSSKELGILGGRVFGCDTCQRVCPLNKDVKEGTREFSPLDYMENPDLHNIAYMDKKTFLLKYKNTSAGWRGKTLLQRNALVALVDKGVKINECDIKAPDLLRNIKEYIKYKGNNRNSK